jgi:hypothetical protein
MPKKASKVAPDADPSDQRVLPRKTALLNAVVCDLNGENAADCFIRDINARSAQISFANNLPIGSEIYLLDTTSKAAYLARVVWNRAGRAGLHFKSGHALNLGLAPKLKFLWRLFLEAKMREVYRFVSSGIPLELALSAAGVTEEHFNQMARYALADKRFEVLFRLGRHARKRLPRRAVPYHKERKRQS